MPGLLFCFFPYVWDAFLTAFLPFLILQPGLISVQSFVKGCGMHSRSGIQRLLPFWRL